MDYEGIKTEILEIAKICSSVPEPFREKCFELLLQHLLAPQQPAGQQGPADSQTVASPDANDTVASGHRETIPIPAPVKVFMRRTGITNADLEKVIYQQDGDIYFLVEPSTKTVSRGQIEWALLMALKNALQGKAFDVDPEDVRSMCQEKGYYDRANFWKTFKSSKSKRLFAGVMEPQGDSRKLTNEGQDELAVVLRELVG